MEADNTTPWMSSTWMQNILRNVENDSTLEIVSYEVKDISSNGDFYLSDMQRIVIHLQRAGNKDCKMFLIAKRLPGGKEMRKTLSESSAFPNEIKMFSHILPKFHAALNVSSPGKFQSLAAEHIYSQNKIPYFLILSDLAPEGFRMADRHLGLDLEHCLLVMKSLGRYHAASVALHDSDPQIVESFKQCLTLEEGSADIMQRLTRSSITSLANHVRSWPKCGEVMANKLLKVADTFYQQYTSQFSPEGNRLNVLIHGDLWVNNMLFKYNDATGRVEDVRFVDFQMSCYKSCAIDLQYFIYTSPKDEVRSAHTEDLLREYHNELCSTLQHLGLAEKSITFQELMDEYERKGVLGFLVSLMCLPHVIESSENAIDFEEVVVGEQYRGSDNGTINKEYFKIMKRLLPVFEQKCYL